MRLKNSPEVTQEYLADGIQWLAHMAAQEQWNLNDAEVASLLGGINVELYRDLKRKAFQGEKLTVTWDMVERISLLLALSKSLLILAPTDLHAITWFNKPNSGSFLKNQSAKDYLLSHPSLTDLKALNDYLTSLIR